MKITTAAEWAFITGLVVSDADLRRRFLPDSDVGPVRPGSAEDVCSPEEFANLKAAMPPAPAIDGAAELTYVLGSFQRRKLIEHAIDSIRRDTEGMAVEIIVIDGGSTDGAVEWLCRQQDVITIVQHNRYVRDGETRRRMSWGRFMNMGFAAASAPWVAMVSDDCYVLPGSTRAALQRVRAAEDAGLKVGGCAYYFRDWPHDGRYRVQRTLAGNLMVNHGLYARAALQAVGFANASDYAFYKADTDLSLRLWAAGYSVIDSPESFCEHYVSPEEAARVSNNAMIEYDRAVMRVKWPGLLGKKAKKMGPIFNDHSDPEGHAERVFGPVLREGF